jgi:hypothetical protein
MRADRKPDGVKIDVPSAQILHDLRAHVEKIEAPADFQDAGRAVSV